MVTHSCNLEDMVVGRLVLKLKRASEMASLTPSPVSTLMHMKAIETEIKCSSERKKYVKAHENKKLFQSR
jgi:hypothetical protein